MPRPIPDDVENVTGFDWFLIPVPSDPVFIAAAWDAFSELTYPWNWGKEGRVPESDIAAQLWSDAIYEALRVRDMGFPDVILDYIDEVETLLAAIRDKPCCDNVSYAPLGGDENTGGATDLEDRVGDPPDTWGNEPIADWSEWETYKCGAARAMATLPAEIMRRFDAISAHEDGAGWVDLIGAALAWIPVVGEPAEILWIWIGNIIDAGLDWAVDFEGAAQEIEAAQADIECAIFQADGVEAAATAMENAVQDAVTGLLASAFVPFFPYQMWTNIIYQGYFINEDGDRVDLDTVITPADDCCIDITDDLELVNRIGTNNAVSGTPTWTTEGDYGLRFEWERSPQDENAEQPRPHATFVFNTPDCVVLAASTVDYQIRVTGDLIDPSGTEATDDSDKFQGAADDMCPDTSAPASPGVVTGPEFTRNLPVDVTVSGSFSVAADTNYVSIGVRIPDHFLDEVDLLFELISLDVTPD